MESIVKSTVNIQLDKDKILLKLVSSQRFDGLNKIMFSSLTDFMEFAAK